jgi:plasmid stability protein
MATLTIRNLDDDVVAALKRQAKENDRSLEAEVRHLLTRRIHGPTRGELLAEADRIAAMTPRPMATDSVDLIREGRDR